MDREPSLSESEREPGPGPGRRFKINSHRLLALSAGSISVYLSPECAWEPSDEIERKKKRN